MSQGQLDSDQVARALACVTPAERWIWGWSIRNNLRKPGTRLSKMVPKYGIEVATQSVVGNMWLGPAVIGGFAGIPLLETPGLGAGAAGIGWALIGMFVVSMCMAIYRAALSLITLRVRR